MADDIPSLPSAADIERVLLETLREVQQLSGHEWCSLTRDSTPIGTLAEFDSLMGIEATVIVEEKLKVKLDLDSLFVSEGGGRALSVQQICARLIQQVHASKESKK